MLVNCGRLRSFLFNEIQIPRNPRSNKHNQFLVSMSNSESMIAEYAKSGRSSCKKCTKAIAKSEVRIGLVSKDPRGFDMTRWHHLQCLPLKPVQEIKGLDSLKSSDQEDLKVYLDKCGGQEEERSDPNSSRKLASRANPTEEEVQDADDESTGKRLLKEIEEDEDRTVAVEQSDIKKRKLLVSAGRGDTEIAFSLSAVKDMYKDAKLLPKWKAFQTIIFLEREEGLLDSKKIAAFDFDGCLANTSVRRIGADAWSLMYASIPEKLQSLYNDGFKLVIFTNEANIEIWKKKRQVAVDSKVGRLENFIKHVKLPIQVFIACGNSRSEPKDPFRKPEPGMWYLMEKHFNSGLPIDMEQSFYVGDAAGRPSDHGDADIKFAEAIGLKFHVPEEFFSQ